MRSPMRHTLHPLGRVHATQAWSAHTSTHEHWHIHCSSRTPRSLAYTQHPDRVSAHIAIAFTRHPDSSLTHHNPTHTTQTHITYTHHIHMSKPKAGKRPVPSCHPSPTLSQTVRQLQHHFSVAKSVTSTARQDVSMHRCDWKHKVGKRPAPSRNRSPTLSQTVRGHRHSPNTISRWQNLLRPPPVPRCAHAAV
jgi:hypothetical protein